MVVNLCTKPVHGLSEVHMSLCMSSPVLWHPFRHTSVNTIYILFVLEWKILVLNMSTLIYTRMILKPLGTQTYLRNLSESLV